MKRKVINRTGEENVNSFGSKMVIKEYRKYMDISVLERQNRRDKSR